MDKIIKNNTAEPKLVYQAKLEQRQAELNDIELTSNRITTVRIVLFIVTMVLAWLSLVENYLSPVWSFALFIVFLAVVIFHCQIAKRQKRAQRAVQFYTQRLDHMAGRWSGQGNFGNRYCNADHSYSADLDVFGEGSLFEFLCGARTRLGEDMLADWLSAGADLKTIQQRQQAVEELRDQLEFREAMFQLEPKANEAAAKDSGNESSNELDQAELQRWIEQAHPIPPWQRVLAMLFWGVSRCGMVGWLWLLASIAGCSLGNSSLRAEFSKY